MICFIQIEQVSPKPEKSLGTSKVPESDLVGLTPGHKHKICVTAINNRGESEPLCTEVDIPEEDPGRLIPGQTEKILLYQLIIKKNPDQNVQ